MRGGGGLAGVGWWELLWRCGEVPPCIPPLHTHTTQRPPRSTQPSSGALGISTSIGAPRPSLHARIPLPHFTSQDFIFNLLTARFDENKGVWAYTLKDMFSLYLRGWFFIDVVRAVNSRTLTRVHTHTHTPHHTCPIPRALRVPSRCVLHLL